MVPAKIECFGQPSSRTEENNHTCCDACENGEPIKRVYQSKRSGESTSMTYSEDPEDKTESVSGIPWTRPNILKPVSEFYE